MLKRLMVVGAALVVLSCTASKPPAPQPPSEPRTIPQARAERLPPADVPVPGSYRIDSSQSELRLLIYRAGALASLGHNHVIQNRSVNGSIDVAPTVASSSFSFSAAVAGFVIDDSQARAEEGDDFSSEVSDSAKSGTWNNMTGPAVLNAEKYPVIGVRSVRVDELSGVLTATVIVTVAGHESSVMVPFKLHKEAYGLSATAAFELNQSAIGLTPFSLMLGALAVRDTMQVKLKIIAVLEAPRLDTPR
jgi:hypothetical protein